MRSAIGKRKNRLARLAKRRQSRLEVLERRQLMAAEVLTEIASIEVTNTEDSGIGSLRWAIEQANLDPAPNRIEFRLDADENNQFEDVDAHLPGGDPAADAFRIRPLSPLPALQDDGTHIDGFSQIEYGGDHNLFGPEIIIDGSSAGPATGFQLRGDSGRISGINIQGFQRNGIDVVFGSDNWISGNYIGTDATGTQSRPNGTATNGSYGGITISAGAQRNLVGSDDDGIDDEQESNLISGNSRHGVRIQAGGSSHLTRYNLIQGNVIGDLPIRGQEVAIGNGGWGVMFLGAGDGRMIGNRVSDNVILGNASGAIQGSTGDDQSDTTNNFHGQDQPVLASAEAAGESYLTGARLLANFDWSMEERTGPDFEYDPLNSTSPGDIPNTLEYIHPADGYAVTLDASGSFAALNSSIDQYRWNIVGLQTEAGEPMDHESQVYGRTPTVHLHEGRYSVTLTITDSRGETSTATGQINVNNILVISIGDSAASGEGNPHVQSRDEPATFGVTRTDAIWADGGDELQTLRNQAAHRSIDSAPAQAAWELEKSSPYTSVTFVSLAATGAEVHDLYHTHSTNAAPDVQLPGQIHEASRLLKRPSGGYREPEAMFISAGVNNVAFAEVTMELLTIDQPDRDYQNTLDQREDKISHQLDKIESEYRALRTTMLLMDLNFGFEVDRNNIFITGYPDPTTDGSADQTSDEIMADVTDPIYGTEILAELDGINEIDREEIMWVREQLIEALNARLNSVAEALGWSYVDLHDSLLGHGYAADDNWIVTWKESVKRQKRDNATDSKITMGVLHPNEKGHAAMAERMSQQAFGHNYGEVVDWGPRILSHPVTIEINEAPSNGAPWQTQVVPIVFSEPIAPGSLSLTDISIFGPDGSPVELVGLVAAREWSDSIAPVTDRPASKYWVTFRPSSLGLHVMSVRSSQIVDLQGNPMDQDHDGINGYTQDGQLRDRYEYPILVSGTIEPVAPLCDPDAPITCTQQYVSVDEPVPFSVATLNAQMRPTDIDEVTPGFLLGMINQFTLFTGESLLDWYYDTEVSETHEDSTERLRKILQAFINQSSYDIIALQEVFDQDQVTQFESGAEQLGYHYLSGPDRACHDLFFADVCFGTNSGLSLLIDEGLSNHQAPFEFEFEFFTHSLQERIRYQLEYDKARQEYLEQFQHRAKPFALKGNGVEEQASQKGFTFDKVQIGDMRDHLVYVVNTHLAAGGKNKPIRKQQIAQIARYVDEHADPRYPVVFLGDFNTGDPHFLDTDHEDHDNVVKRYDHMLDTLKAVDPVHELAKEYDAAFETSDLNRNPYKLFENKRSPEFYNSGHDATRVDHILIRQGSLYGVEVENLRLEDGTGRGDLFETELYNQWKEQYPEFFTEGRLVPFISDHFGLGADLVFVDSPGGPKVVNTSGVYAIAERYLSDTSNTRTIELEFDREVNVSSVENAVLLRTDAGVLLPNFQVKPVWDNLVSAFAYDSGDISDVFTEARSIAGASSDLRSLPAPDQVFHDPSLSSGESRESGSTSLEDVRPTDITNAFRARSGRYATRFEITFELNGADNYVLSVASSVSDRYGRRMDQDEDGQTGTSEDAYQFEIHTRAPAVDITSMATGDLNGDGIDELYTVFSNYDGSWIYRSHGGLPSKEVLSSANQMVVTAIAAGDVDGGSDELFVGLKQRGGDATILRFDSFADQGEEVYSSRSTLGNLSLFRGKPSVQALAVGNVDGSGHAELFTALEFDNGDARIYRSLSGTDLGSEIYDSPDSRLTRSVWTVQALATGDVDGNGVDELYSAFEKTDGDALIYRSTTGDGIGPPIYKSKVPGTWTVNALTTGDMDGDGRDELLSGFENSSLSSYLYRSASGLGIGGLTYQNEDTFNTIVDSMAAGDLDGDGVDRLYAYFTDWEERYRGTLYESPMTDTHWLDLDPISADSYLLYVKDDEGTTTEQSEANTDFGDAPDPYSTRFGDNGAFHIASGPRLGRHRDTETNGQPSANASSAASDDDGVQFGLMQVDAAMAALNVTLEHANSAKVDAWIDFDRDGVWNANEKVLASVDVVSGLQTLNFNLPVRVTAGDTFARVRVSSAGGLEPTGPAADGEVEDYLVTIQSSSPKVEDVQVNGGDRQRSSVTKLRVTFDREVTAPASAFSIKDRDSMAVVDSLVVNSSVVDGKTVSTLTFDPGNLVVGENVRSLIDGKYQLEIEALQIAAVGGGPRMDRDVNFGDDEADAFFRKYGDHNGNGIVDLLDYANFRQTFGKSKADPGYLEDLDAQGDGVIGLLDFAEFRRNFGR